MRTWPALLAVLLAITLSSFTISIGSAQAGDSAGGPYPIPAPASPGSYLINLSSGVVTRIGDNVEAAWSPDGSRLALAEQPVAGEGGGGLQILDLSDGTSVSVVAPNQGSSSNLQWSPDGSLLAFSLEGGPGVTAVPPLALDLVAADGAGGARLVASGVIAFAWMPDSQGLSVIQVQPTDQSGLSSRIVTLDPYSGQVIETLLASGGAGCQIGLAWSPDGAYLAYGGSGFHQGCGDPRNAGQQGAGLYVWQAATGDTVQLFAGSAVPPQWTASGQVLDEVSAIDNGPLSISLRSFQPDGSGSTILADNLPTQFPPPRPLFQTAAGVIVYSLADCTDGSVFVFEPGEAMPQRLTNTSEYAISAELAPDGSSIAWVQAGTLSSDLMMSPIGGGAPLTLLYGASGLSLQGWSPDAGTLLFSVTPQQQKPCFPG